MEPQHNFQFRESRIESSVQPSSACLLNQSGFFRIRLDQCGSTGEVGTFGFSSIGVGVVSNVSS